MKKVMIVLAAVVVAGCIKTVNPDPTESSTSRTNGTYAICIGVENGYAGECTGSALDCKRMTKLLQPYTSKMVTFTDSQATREAVVKKIAEGVQFPLFILYYSGHGGSAPAYLDTEETDGKDEYLCLYDRPLLDDDIWKLISKSKGRVFLMFDCCHSGSMFKSPMNFSSQIQFFTATTDAKGPITMLCWAGCPDDTYSYGSESGGELTNTLLKYFKANMTYDQLWTKIENDKTLKTFETVQRTRMGTDFGGQRVFR